MTDFAFGIEEEYFLSDAVTRGTRRRNSQRFLAACRARFPDEVQQEMLQSQIEVAAGPFATPAAARGRLKQLRAGLGDIAAGYGMRLLAASTHPTAAWTQQSVTEKDRYEKLLRDLKMIGSRNMVCGMHVHVELPDPGQRVDLMNRVQPFLPLLFALTTSSPFWQAHPTGLKAYRLAAYREMPRTGLPELFASAADYQRYVDTLVASGAIENASFVWWVIRPSLKHPTLELRVADVCTRLDDAITVAVLYRCLIRHLVRNPAVNADVDAVSRGITGENIWLAQRHGVAAQLVDRASRCSIPVPDLVAALVDQLRDDADALDCGAELEAARAIAACGTSADRQLEAYRAARRRGLGRHAALAEVVDGLTAETQS